MFMSPEADHYSIYKYTEERTGLPLFLICRVQNSSCNKIGKNGCVCRHHNIDQRRHSRISNIY